MQVFSVYIRTEDNFCLRKISTISCELTILDYEVDENNVTEIVERQGGDLLELHRNENARAASLFHGRCVCVTCC